MARSISLFGITMNQNADHAFKRAFRRRFRHREEREGKPPAAFPKLRRGIRGIEVRSDGKYEGNDIGFVDSVSGDQGIVQLGHARSDIRDVVLATDRTAESVKSCISHTVDTIR